MSLLLDTGLFKSLTERFDAIAMDLGLPGKETWDGVSFAPLLNRLAQAVQDGTWTDKQVSLFIAQAFETGTAKSAPDSYETIVEAYAKDSFFLFLAQIGTDPKQFFNGDTGIAAADLAPVAIKLLIEVDTPDNQAPLPTDLLLDGLQVLEGDVFQIDTSQLFRDPDGDRLAVKLVDHDQLLTILGEQDGILTIRAHNGLEGSFKFQFMADDGQLATDVATMIITVADAGAGAEIMTRNQARSLSVHDSLEQALAAGGDNMAYRLLRQSGIDTDGPVTIAANNIILAGAAGMTGQFVLAGSARAITLSGDATFDVSGNDQRNVLLGNAGGNALSGGAESDRILGNGGHDRLDGGTGRDHLIGGDGDDQIVGGAQDDRLIGGTGADVLDGGAGIDRGWGGEGGDRFIFRAGEQRTMAMDFAAGEDVIGIAGFAGVNNFAALLDIAHITQVRDDLRIAIGADQLIIKNITEDALVAGDFTFG